MAPPMQRGSQMSGKGGGRGKGGKGGGRGVERGLEMGRELAELDDSSVQLESKLEILRAERAAQRSGRSARHDTVREDEGVDEADPLNNMDEGVRLEPFNMRREMAEGHFDEAGMYILNKDEEKEVTDAWLDTVDQAEKTATFQQEERYKKAQELAALRMSALKKNLGKDADEEEEQDEDNEEKDGCWIIEIDKSSGGRLGFGLDVKHSEGQEDRIEIEDIDETGLLAAWNKANPAKAVEPGDRILQLNGESTTEAITGGLGQQTILKIKFIREEKLEEPEEEKETSVMIETLVNDLMPLETPTMALARLTKGLGRPVVGSVGTGREPLKVRARMKKDRLAEKNKSATSEPVASITPASSEQKQGKKRLNEWGDYETGPSTKEQKVEAIVDNSNATVSVPSEMGKDVVTSGSDGVESKEHNGNGTETVKQLSSNTSIQGDKEAAIAAAAEKAAAEDKAVAEAAAAAASEVRMSRHNLYMALEIAKGPEAAALAEAKKRQSGENVEERPSAATLAAASKKRTAEPGLLEKARRAKIEKLTDLCDRLLERGVLVYDSTREQLAIEFRERRGEFEEKEVAEQSSSEAAVEKAVVADDSNTQTDISKDGQTSGSPGDTNGTSSSSTSDAVTKEPTLTFVNKRVTPASNPSDDSAPSGLLGLLSNESGKMDVEGDIAPVSAGRPLMWQFRWEATPEQSHGPFDSMTMHGWMTQGCFSEERRAEVRQCDDANSPTEQCWHPLMEMNFELYF